MRSWSGVPEVRDSRPGGCRLGRIAGAAAIRAIIIVGLLSVVTGCTASPGPATASAKATTGTAKATTGTTSAAGADGRCSHPFPGNGDVSACVYPGGLYSVSYRDENQYYWHPAPGDFAVAET